MKKFYNIIGRNSEENTLEVVKKLKEQGWTNVSEEFSTNPEPNTDYGRNILTIMKLDETLLCKNEENLYKVVSRSMIVNFENVINEFMEEGFVPVGKICINPNPTLEVQTYMQSIVKTKKDIINLEYCNEITIGRSTISNLESVVMELMDDGYMPFGGVEINPNPTVHKGTYVQKMVK